MVLGISELASLELVHIPNTAPSHIVAHNTPNHLTYLQKMSSIRPVTPTQTSPNHSIIKPPPTKSPSRSPRRSPRKSPYSRNSPSKRPSLSSKMSQKSATTPKSDSKAKTSNQAESSKPRTKDELYEWIYGSKGKK